MWIVQGKEEHKLGHKRPKECCVALFFGPCSCCLRGWPALFDHVRTSQIMLAVTINRAQLIFLSNVERLFLFFI